MEIFTTLDQDGRIFKEPNKAKVQILAFSALERLNLGVQRTWKGIFWILMSQIGGGG